MHLGGAEVSLIGLLQALDPKKVDIDLFVYSHEGELMKLIPEYVNVLPEVKSYSMFERPMVEVLKKGHWGVLAARLIAKYQAKHGLGKPTGNNKSNFDDDAYRGKWVSKVVSDINPCVEYDLAISFLTPHNFVCDHVRAKKKICWIHTDYSRITINSELELPVWDSYDNIISISDDVTKTFIDIFPSLAPKIIVIENILSSAFVRSRADECEPAWEKQSLDILRILSIGRFSEQKNFDNLPFICSTMINELKVLLSIGCFCEKKNYDNVLDKTRRKIEFDRDIKWYIIGYGGDEDIIRQKIVEAGMQDHVIILGKKDNPYPYIKTCDIYVQPSRYEGKSVTVREAQMLCKPVVVTNYPTASSQIQDGVDGVIVPMDNKGCAKELAFFILDAEKQNKITDYLKAHDYGNVNEVCKIYNILGI